MTNQLRFLASTVAAAVLLAVFFIVAAPTQSVSAQSTCGDPDPATLNPPNSGNLYGRATTTVDIPSDGTYTVWSRIEAQDSNTNSYYLSVADNCNIIVGNNDNMVFNDWVWVDYDSQSNPIEVNLSQGSQEVVMIGREANLKLDRVLFLTDGCVPEGTGENCMVEQDVEPPTVNITVPTLNSSVEGRVAFAADASDGAGIDRVEFFFDDNTSPAFIERNAPYEYVVDGGYDTTQLSDGQHTMRVVAYDANGNSSEDTVTFNVVNNTAVGSSTIFLDPTSGSYTTGDTIEVDLRVTSPDVYDTAQVRVIYDPSILEFVNADYTGTNFGQNISPTAESDYVELASGSTNDLTGESYLGKVVFRVLNIENGTTTINIDAVESSVVNNGADLAASVGGIGIYTLVDRVAPTAPENLEVTGSSSTRVDLLWTDSTDNVQVAGYNIYRDGQRIADNILATDFTDDSVNPGNTYVYTVRAVDIDGNESIDSNTARVTVSSLAGDANGDNRVDVFDLSQLITDWRTTADSPADFNGDGVVNVFDLSILVSNWGS